MKKELNKKLKLDSINWVDVINGLEGKLSFKDHDIKRALKKTGRSFNNNGPFHTVVREFISSLGEVVKTEIVSGEAIYTITSTEAALKAVGYKEKEKEREEFILPFDRVFTPKKVEEKEEKKNEIPDHEKIKVLFKRSYLSLEHAICLLAIFMKYEKTELSSRVITTEMTEELKIKYNTFMARSKPVVISTYKCLGFNLVLKKNGLDTIWKLEDLNKGLLDIYTNLCEIYEKVSGKKPKNLDNYITTKASTEETKRRYEDLKEKETQKKEKVSFEPRAEKDPEVLWKKWLLISSSRNSFGASRSISNLISWIRTERHYTIEEGEARRLYRELMEDSGRELNLSSDYITCTEDAWKILSKFYSPKKNFRETILVKLPLPLEKVSNIFQNLKFKLEETTISGEYLYTVEMDRRFSCEISLKKLLRFIQMTGKIYENNSWMVKRAQDIISKEDSDEKSKNIIFLGLENKI